MEHHISICMLLTHTIHDVQEVWIWCVSSVNPIIMLIWPSYVNSDIVFAILEMISVLVFPEALLEELHVLVRGVCIDILVYPSIHISD